MQAWRPSRIVYNRVELLATTKKRPVINLMVMNENMEGSVCLPHRGSACCNDRITNFQWQSESYI
jgi:hypothetical protein